MGNMQKLQDNYSLLAAQTIHQALMDLTAKDPVKGKETRDYNYAEDAKAWFNERRTEPFGYGWCLQLTSWSPTILRRIIEKRERQKRSRELA